MHILLYLDIKLYIVVNNYDRKRCKVVVIVEKVNQPRMMYTWVLKEAKKEVEPEQEEDLLLLPACDGTEEENVI